MNEFVSDAAVGEYGYLMDRGLVPLETSTLSKVRSNVKNLNSISMQETTVPTADQVVGIFPLIMVAYLIAGLALVILSGFYLGQTRAQKLQAAP